jgi:ABC-2 type transport system ATP-binding protein
VEIDALAVCFGELRAVRDVSLRVQFEEIHLILGPNGAGKTTTVETLLGFRSPSAGTVRLMGLDPVRDHREVVQRVGALLQRGGVWSTMSPRDALRLTSSYYGAPRDVGELISALSLSKCAKTPWRRLSGGEQQRTLLALALLGRPRVLVLDEPTSALDPEGHRVIRDILRAERDRGCAIVITTHQLADAEALADRVTVIARGAVAASGTLEELSGDAVLVVETSKTIDHDMLALALGVAVTVQSNNTYRLATANTPEVLGVLTNFLAAQNAALSSLRSRATLEETYLDIVGNETSES